MQKEGLIYQKEQELKEFAQKYNLKINPKYTFRYWAWLIVNYGGRCICDSKRTHCPCEFVLDELKSKGFCFCKFFMTEEYYNEFVEFYKKRGKRIKKKEAPV